MPSKPLNKIKEAMLDNAFLQKIVSLTKKVTDHINNFMPHDSGLNQYASLPDANSIYTKIEFKRQDDSLYMMSLLSEPNIEGQYTKATWTFYQEDGISDVLTKVWTITYDANGIPIAKEVL